MSISGSSTGGGTTKTASDGRVTRFPPLFSPEVAADPHAFYRRLRAVPELPYDDAVGGHLLSRFEDCATAYRNPVFTVRAYDWLLEPIHGRTILQMDGAEHGRRRRLLSPAFHGEGLAAIGPMITEIAVETLESVVQQSAENLVNDLGESREADLVEGFANRFPVNVIADMLGVPEPDRSRFRGWYVTIVSALSNLVRDPAVDVQIAETRREIEAYFLPLIRARRAELSGDLISRLAVAEVEGDRMSDEEIKAYVSLLLTAGAETTDRALGSLFKNLLEHPAQWDSVREDRRLVRAAIAESLRISPPTQINLRQTAEEFVLGETALPAGATAVILIGSANRDERKYERADEFDIHRADLDVDRAFTQAGHLAFGAGRHFCLGAHLARTEMETALSLFLDRFPDLRLADGFVPRDVGLKMRGPVQLRVRL